MEEEQKTEVNPLEEARALVEEMKKHNEEYKNLLSQQQEIAARQLLGGKSSAGKEQEIKKELTAKEYTESLMKGKLPE